MESEIQRRDVKYDGLQPLTKGRIARAFAVAVVIDLIQLPINLAFFTGLFSVPSEILDLGLDVVASVMISRLIGFHWAFLPSFLVESVPGLDLCPTWIAAVAYVSWRRKKQPAAPPPINATVVEAEAASGLRERLTS